MASSLGHDYAAMLRDFGELHHRCGASDCGMQIAANHGCDGSGSGDALHEQRGTEPLRNKALICGQVSVHAMQCVERRQQSRQQKENQKRRTAMHVRPPLNYEEAARGPAAGRKKALPKREQ
ncbi:MAG: hypothetical protein HXY39_02245 [Chloroflexi bacterium]|nr:hypothetical protein [Chloroflexota bacterium]